MDFRTLATFLALFFTTSDADHATLPRVFSTSRPNSGIKPNYTEVSTFTTTTSVSRDGELTQQLAVSSLFVLTVEWTTTCGGHLVLHHAATAPPMPSSHVCYDGGQNIKNLSLNLCKNRKGCRDNLRWDKGRTGEKDGFYISDRGVELSSCETMTIHCAVETEDVLSEVQQQLRVYKTLMALLCCVLLLLLLLRFTRPTVRAIINDPLPVTVYHPPPG
ncbi:uncharacterized protein LOC107989006 [Cynoglossus semilaevis]|uniref:uncharacterized protein LOC107989006 n=1 Tax=Cynoglossus semilaevis TaxID=244447 RepID=UPI0007DC8B5A|nr:uncharacterized protein LOC107989006 [Cynoglossus semilaevis]